MKTRDAGSIGDIATVKKRNGTGIDESNVVISIYFLFFAERRLYLRAQSFFSKIREIFA